MSHDVRLAEMLATRLCHDLTGPIGAVNNGAEFLDDEGFDMQNEAVQLILSSAHEAVNRLQFYRQAYGRMGDVGEACLEDKKKIASDFFSGTKIKLDWPDSQNSLFVTRTLMLNRVLF
jgi:histidine phosphotransferase ChpT